MSKMSNKCDNCKYVFPAFATINMLRSDPTPTSSATNIFNLLHVPGLFWIMSNLAYTEKN